MHGWEGFDWDNILSIPRIPEGIYPIGSTTFAYMIRLESLQLDPEIGISLRSSQGLPGSASLSHWKNSAIPFLFPLKTIQLISGRHLFIQADMSI